MGEVYRAIGLAKGIEGAAASGTTGGIRTIG